MTTDISTPLPPPALPTGGFAAVAAGARPEALSTQADATYAGSAIVLVWQKGNMATPGFFEAGTPRARQIAGDGSEVRMTVDLAAGTISGEIVGIVRGSRSGIKPNLPHLAAGRIVMEPAAISSDGFAGSMRAADGFQYLGAATYSGRFYGTNAREVVCVVGAESDTILLTGAFRVLQG